MVRPSALMRAAISGKAPLERAPQAWLSFIVYNHACTVLLQPDKPSRREALQRVPEPIRQLVEDEVKRLWEQRR
jgi:hypothetical protein